MEWITQNWLWIVFGIGFFMLMRRGGMGCGHAGHRHGAGPGDHHDGAAGAGSSEGTTDPVSGKTVDRRHAIASFYQGTPIYFESRENRDRFEAAPEQFPGSHTKPAAASGHGHGHC